MLAMLSWVAYRRQSSLSEICNEYGAVTIVKGRSWTGYGSVWDTRCFYLNRELRLQNEQSWSVTLGNGTNDASLGKEMTSFFSSRHCKGAEA